MARGDRQWPFNERHRPLVRGVHAALGIDISIVSERDWVGETKKRRRELISHPKPDSTPIRINPICERTETFDFPVRGVFSALPLQSFTHDGFVFVCQLVCGRHGCHHRLRVALLTRSAHLHRRRRRYERLQMGSKQSLIEQQVTPQRRSVTWKLG